VEEPPLLMAVQRVVGGVEIEDDPARRCLVCLEEESDEQPLDRRPIVADLVVARGSDRRVLEPVQRALAGERGAVLASRLELAGQRREHGVVAQLIVVDEILVPQRDPEHPLRHHGRDAVLDQGRCAAVLETGGEPVHQADRPISGPKQHRSGIRRRITTVKRRLYCTPFSKLLASEWRG